MVGYRICGCSMELKRVAAVAVRQASQIQELGSQPLEPDSPEEVKGIMGKCMPSPAKGRKPPAPEATPMPTLAKVNTMTKRRACPRLRLPNCYCPRSCTCGAVQLWPWPLAR